MTPEQTRIYGMESRVRKTLEQAAKDLRELAEACLTHSRQYAYGSDPRATYVQDAITHNATADIIERWTRSLAR